MVKSLIDRIKKGFRKGCLLASIMAGLKLLTGCADPFPYPDPTPIEENIPPEIISNPIVQVDEGNLYNYDVNAIDKDGDNLEYSLIGAPSWLSINPITGVISGIAPEVGSDTNYAVKTKVSDGEDFNVQDYTLKVKDIPEPNYMDISGKLEDCEEDDGKAGTIKVYDATDNSYLDECTADASGDFSITLDKKVSELPDGVILQGRIGSESDWESYIRTMELPQGDHENVLVRAVPYDNPDATYDDGLISTSQDKEDFKEHMDRVNFSDAVYINPAPEPGSHYLKKWNHGELENTTGHPIFQGIEISTDFSTEEQDNIENAIRNSGYLKAGEIIIERGKNHEGEFWLGIY